MPVPAVTLQLFSGPVTVSVDRGELLLEGVRRRGVQLSFQCREATCAKCRVRVLAGQENLSEPGRKERARLGDDNIADGMRLACQVQVYGDVEVSQ
jgi:ferredoxin